MAESDSDQYLKLPSAPGEAMTVEQVQMHVYIKGLEAQLDEYKKHNEHFLIQQRVIAVQAALTLHKNDEVYNVQVNELVADAQVIFTFIKEG